jgi:hypothetical protein
VGSVTCVYYRLYLIWVYRERYGGGSISVYIYMCVCVCIYIYVNVRMYINMNVCGDDDDDDYVKMPARCWFFSELRLAIEMIENGFGGFPFKHGNHEHAENWREEWPGDPIIEIKRKLPPQLPQLTSMSHLDIAFDCRVSWKLGLKVRKAWFVALKIG